MVVESREKEKAESEDDASDSSASGAIRTSSLTLVDLAGSENVKHAATGGKKESASYI